MKKEIKIVFKNGVVVNTQYSYAVFKELNENMGKDHKVEVKNFSTNCKEIVGIFYEVNGEAEHAKEA